MTSWRQINGVGVGDVLVIVDHASNFVPADLDLGIDAALLDTHIAWDIGTAALAQVMGLSAHLATVSRLVIDLNREEDSPGLIPVESDGVRIPGNPGDRTARIERFWRPYHDELQKLISKTKPELLVSLHSFTPLLAAQPDAARPWEIGILYRDDDRAARIAIPMLEEGGAIVGDQLPYSGKLLNATMNRHGEGTGTPYLGIEVRQDLISSPRGVEKMACILLPVIEKCVKQLTGGKGSARR